MNVVFFAQTSNTRRLLEWKKKNLQRREQLTSPLEFGENSPGAFGDIRGQCRSDLFFLRGMLWYHRGHQTLKEWRITPGPAQLQSLHKCFSLPGTSPCEHSTASSDGCMLHPQAPITKEKMSTRLHCYYNEQSSTNLLGDFFYAPTRYSLRTVHDLIHLRFRHRPRPWNDFSVNLLYRPSTFV